MNNSQKEFDPSKLKMTTFAKQRADVAVCFGWEPIDLENNLLIMAQIKGNPVKFVEEKTNEEKCAFLLIDATEKAMLPENYQGFCKTVSAPLVELKSQFGPEGQICVDKACKALFAQDFEKAKSNIREACKNNANFVNKVDETRLQMFPEELEEDVSVQYAEVIGNLMKKSIKQDRHQDKQIEMKRRNGNCVKQKKEIKKEDSSAKPVF